jgi:predicted Zn finger-like uncharacterized protein
MSLATRCSACSTVFRVQQDQLKASEGWVRCGRCGTVFSALEGLFDLERESTSGAMPLDPPPGAAPKPLPPIALRPSPSPAPPADADSFAYYSDASAADDVDEEPLTQPLVRDSLRHAKTDLPIEPLAASSADQAAAAASFTAAYGNERDDDDDAALLTEHSGHHTTFDESAPVYTGPAPLAPSFVRSADRDARWQRPVVRRLTIAAALALPLLLGAQVALHHRDLVAARWPGSADLLAALCASLHCSVHAPRSLDAVSVESSGLTRVEGAPLYKLQVAVRNRADWAVAMPALDLTLTDPRGEIVTRRVLRAAELGGTAPEALAAGTEWSALATLDVGDRRVTGYTIDLFYP